MARALKVIDDALEKVRSDKKYVTDTITELQARLQDLDAQEVSLLEAQGMLGKGNKPPALPRIVNNGTAAPRIEWDLVPGALYKVKWDGKYVDITPGNTSWTITPTFPGNNRAIGWSWGMTKQDDHWIAPELSVSFPPPLPRSMNPEKEK